MTTFSQLVDAAVSESKRPDMRDDIVRYVNQTIREIHFEPVGNSALFYVDNYREDQLVVADASRATWTIPRPEIFQKELCIRFDGAFDRDGNPVYARRSTPGPSMGKSDHFYYRAQNAIVMGGMRGVGNVGSTVSIAYYEFPRSLKYYDIASRPVNWEDDYGFLYGPKWIDPLDVLEDASLKEQAIDLSTNWLLRRWTDVISEGVRAKIYKRTGDAQRGTTCYSLYQQLRQGLRTSETADLTAYYKA